MKIWDVVIAGAGPAGLSAALVLARARRRVLVCDTGTPRSRASKQMHAYLSRDGIRPGRFRALCMEEVLSYPTVRFLGREVIGARRRRVGFDVKIAGRAPARCRKLLIATGLYDVVPDIPGLADLYGRSVFQCPYCDGWEVGGQRIAVYGRRRRGVEIARAMTAWTEDIVLCTDGPTRISREDRRALARNGIAVIQKPIRRLAGARGKLRSIVFADGEQLARDALFFDTPSRPQSRLAESLGCRFGSDGGVLCGDYEASSVPGVFVAGNIIRDVQLSIVAAAEGARAAFGINRSLTREDFELRASGRFRPVHPGGA